MFFYLYFFIILDSKNEAMYPEMKMYTVVKQKKIFVDVSVYLYLYICIYLSIYLSIYLYTCTYTYIYVYIYTYIYI